MRHGLGVPVEVELCPTEVGDRTELVQELVVAHGVDYRGRFGPMALRCIDRTDEGAGESAHGARGRDLRWVAGPPRDGECLVAPGEHLLVVGAVEGVDGEVDEQVDRGRRIGRLLGVPGLEQPPACVAVAAHELLDVRALNGQLGPQPARVLR